MKRFITFLIEQTQQTLNPRRQDFPEGEEGQQQYLQAMRDTAAQQKREADQMTSSAETQANVLKNVETGLKVAETAADAALTAGAVAVPGAGTALNAAVKGLKGTAAATQGDYGKAALYAADAALPAVGSLASKAGSASGLVKSAGEVVNLGKDVAKFVSNPISQAVEQGVARVPQVSRAVQATTNVLSKAGLGIPAANIATQTTAKTALKVAGEEAKDKSKSTGLSS